LTNAYPQQFILASPKAGTTAVHSFLLFHPQVRASKEKEGRYFDDPRRFIPLLRGQFMKYTYVPVKDNTLQVNVDSTPSYIENIQACQRIAAIVPATSRFVIVLRHPVKRLWSRQQMERRKLYNRRMASTKYLNPNEWTAFADCVVKPGCTMHQLNIHEGPSDDFGTHIKPLAIVLQALQQMYAADSKSLGDCLASADALADCLQPGMRLGDVIKKTFDIDPVTGLLLYDRQLFASWQTLLDKAAVHESRRMCELCPKQSRRVVKVALHQCVGCRCTCYRQLGLLGKSLYRAQIDHCLEHLDASRFLFVDYNEMIKDYAGTMNRVTAHAGLERFDYSRITTQMAKERFDAVFPKFKVVTGWKHDLAPSWVTNVSIPASLEQRLNEFYASDAPYLRQLTGLKLEGWD